MYSNKSTPTQMIQSVITNIINETNLDTDIKLQGLSKYSNLTHFKFL